MTKPPKAAPTFAAAFFRERNAEFNQAAATRTINQMRTRGARLHLQYRADKPSWSLGDGKTVPAEIAEIITKHALVKPAGGAVRRHAGAIVGVRTMSETPLKVIKSEPAPPTAPNDALDIEALWQDQALGDGLTETSWQTIPVEKPRDFFRVHPDPAFRRRTEIYVHKIEGEIETSYYILGPKMKGRLEEARPCVLVTCIYRDGSPRLWPIMFPRDGEKDNTAWTSARSAARTGIDKWVRLVWSKRSYLTRDALPGYAPDPDWGKLPAFNDLVKAALGQHGVIQDTDHPIYRELMGAPATVNADGDI